MSSSPRPQPTAHENGAGCSRRDYLERVGLAAGTIVTVGAAGSKVAPRYAPIGRAAAFPVLAAGVAVSIGAAIILGVGLEDEELRGEEEFSALQRLGLWADAYQSGIQHEAQDLNMTGFVTDFVNFGKSNAYNEAAVEAVLEADEGATQTEAIGAAEDHLAGMLSNGLESLLKSAAHANKTLQNYIDDAELIDDLDPVEPLVWRGEDITSVNSWSVDEWTYTLFDGREVTLEFLAADTIEYGSSSSGLNHSTAPLAEPTSDGVSERNPSDYVTVEGPADQELRFGEGHAWEIAEFPTDEYDALDEETKESIDPPEETGPVTIYDAEQLNSAVEAYLTFYEETISEVQTFLENVWTDLQNDDTNPEDVLTAGMLASMSSDQDTFPYAGGSLAALGLPHSAQTVTLRFPDETDENGDPVEHTGNLYAEPMPSGGFDVGQQVTPSELESRFWFAFHTVDEETGQKSSDIGELTDPFEIVKAESVQDGEVVEEDQLTWSETETQAPPENWEELQAMRDQIADLERQIAAQQNEIVVDLEGAAEGGGGDWWPDFGDGGAGGPLIGALVVLAAIVGLGQITS